MRKSFGGCVKGPKHPSKTKVDAEKMIFYPKRLHYWFLKIAPEKLPKQETVQKPKKGSPANTINEFLSGHCKWFTIFYNQV